MAATTTPAETAPRRPRFRLSTMEVLGFIETPGTAISSAVTWTETTVDQVEAAPPAMPGPALPTATDPFDGWMPQELGSRFLKGRVRWGMVIFLVGILALVATGMLWLYQRPEIDARGSRQEVLAGIDELTPGLDRLLALNTTLTEPVIDAVEVNSVMLAVDAAVRRLFDVGAGLPASDGLAKTSLFDATGDTADAIRLFGDAYAYRSGVVPILASPTLESDPGLISLEQAAAAFSDWQGHFEATRGALPGGTLADVTEALGSLSDLLPQLQREYLDALRIEDVAASTGVVNRLVEELASIEMMVFQGLTEIQRQISVLVSDAKEGLDSLASLFG